MENNKNIKGKNVLSKKGLIKSGLAVTVLGTTVAGPFMTANAAEDANTKTDDNKTSDNKSAKMKINVDNKKINKAVNDAKKAGVNIKKGSNKNHDVKIKDVDKTQKEIQADYDKQIKKINQAKEDYSKKKADYDKKEKAYQDAVKNPKFNGGKTEFSKDQLVKFLGNNPQNVTYITGNQGDKKMTFNKGNLKSPSKAQLNETYTDDNGRTNGYPEKSYAKPYLLEKGSHWTYKHALKDNKTGNDIDVKYTVTDIKVDKSHKFGNSPVADIRTNALGVNMMTPIDEASYDVEYFDSETGKPVKIDALNGMGDLDGDQYYKLNTKMESALKGSKVVQDGNQSWKAESVEQYDTDDPSTQVWNIAKGVSKQNFTWGSRQERAKDYHGADLWINGNIEFGLELPKKPTPPKKPKVNYQLHTLNAIPENHKDVEKGIQKEDTEATINGEKVEVGDQITYPLTNSNLSKDRADDIKSYVMKDKLPEGVTPDKDAIAKNVDKSKWDVKIDGNNVTISATKELLSEMNKDKSKEFKVPTVGLVATVTKGGDANLDNTFDTIINDKTVRSNKVTNTPPPIVKKQAKKSVSTNEIIDFGKEYSYGLDFTVPNDKAYKKVQFKDHDMTEGSLDFEDVKVYADIDKSNDSKADDSKSDDSKSDDSKSDESKAEDTSKADDSKADDSKSDDSKSNDSKSDDSKADDSKSDDSKADDSKADDSKADDSKADNSKADDSKSDNSKADNSKPDDTAPAVDPKGTENTQAGEENNNDKTDATKSDDSNSKGQDVTDQGKLEFDKEKDSFVWTANDPSKFLGKKVHIDVKAKVKAGKTLDKYKTNEKDKDGNIIYSLPNIGHMVLDDEDTPTNEVPIKVVEKEPSIKKYIVEDGKLIDKNHAKEGDKLTYQLNAQFGTKTPKSISDQLDKEKLDLNDVKVFEDNSKSDESKSDESKSDDSKSDNTKSDESKTDDSKSDESKVDNSKTDDSKADDSETTQAGEESDNTAPTVDPKGTETTQDKDTTSDNSKSDDSKSDDSKSDDSKSDDSKSDDSKSDDSKSDDSKSDDSKSDDAPDVGKAAFDTKNAKDITSEGELKLDKDNESFTWTPKDPSKFHNKKVKVMIDSTIKKDLKYENGKAQIDNIATLKDGKDYKSNKVTTDLDKKEDPKQPDQPAKENPKDPDQPAKETPQKETPQKESPQKESPLPSTGSKTMDGLLYGGIIGLIAASVGGYIYKRRNNN